MSNAIAISRNLIASGLTQAQAEAIAENIVTHTDESLATKADIVRVEGRLDNHATKADLADLRAEAKAEFARLEVKTDAQATMSKIMLGAIVALIIAVLAPQIAPAPPQETATTAQAAPQESPAQAKP